MTSFRSMNAIFIELVFRKKRAMVGVALSNSSRTDCKSLRPFVLRHLDYDSRGTRSDFLRPQGIEPFLIASSSRKLGGIATIPGTNGSAANVPSSARTRAGV